VFHFGYVPDPAYTDSYVKGLSFPHLAMHLPHLMRQRTKRDVYLWEALLAVKPSWQRGAQGIGDCVSWGAELCATILLAQLAVTGQSAWIEEAATEAIYGGCRVEALGERAGGYEDGAAGSWAAQWLNNFGVLLRIDYSQQTGNPDHDLRHYDERRAKEWGNYGCGGENDKGALDAIAKVYPVKDVTQVRSVEEAAASIDAGCPVSVASMAGFGDMKRDAEGICRIDGSWAHQMMFAGVRHLRGEPFLQCFQSWGKSCSGPFPGIAHPAILDCSWLVSPEDANKMLGADDSFAYSRVEGFALPPWDFSKNFFV
jgi:hypothetical protein